MTLPAHVPASAGLGESPFPMLPFQEVSPNFPLKLSPGIGSPAGLVLIPGMRCLNIGTIICFVYQISVHSSNSFSLHLGYLTLFFAHGPL